MPGTRNEPEERAGFWAAAYTHPDKAAIIGPGETQVTYGELVARVNRLSHLLRSLGLHPGDHVSVSWTDSSGNSHHANVTLEAGPPA